MILLLIGLALIISALVSTLFDWDTIDSVTFEILLAVLCLGLGAVVTVYNVEKKKETSPQEYYLVRQIEVYPEYNDTTYVLIPKNE